MEININQLVRVKLTDKGRQIHREEFESLFPKETSLFEYRTPHEDEEGWSVWQLWYLMSIFGSYLNNGMDVPFETTIEIVE